MAHWVNPELTYTERWYTLQDFEPCDVEKAKEFMKKVWLGWARAVADEKANEFIALIADKPFRQKDTFTFQFNFECLGNDILSALGMAMEERVK